MHVQETGSHGSALSFSFRKDVLCELSNYACKKGIPAVQSCCICKVEDMRRACGCRLYACVYIDVACMYNVVHVLRIHAKGLHFNTFHS